MSSVDDRAACGQPNGGANLELHLVRVLPFRQRETGANVLAQDGRHLLHDPLVDGRLERLPLGRQCLLSLVGLEELVRLLLGGRLRLDEERIGDGLGELDGRLDIDLGRRGQNVGLRHTTQRDPVDLERTRDQEQAGLELLQEDNAFAFEAPSQQDQHRTGSNAGTQFRRLLHRPSAGERLDHPLRRVHSRLLVRFDGQRLLDLLVLPFRVLVPHGLLEAGDAAERRHTAGQFAVARRRRLHGRLCHRAKRARLRW